MAERHRHSTGVPGDALNDDPKARRAGDRRHDSDRKVVLQQYRSLLDMDFQIAAQCFRRRASFWIVVEIDAFLAQDRGETDIAHITPRQCAFVEAAGDGAAAEIGRGKPHAFLLGKSDHLEMEGQALAGLFKMLRNDEPGQNAKPAVEVAGIGDGVVMRSNNQSFG